MHKPPLPPPPSAAVDDPVGDPLAALDDGGVLAVVTGVEGPHYRSPGAIMGFPAAGGAVGQLSSGCIEADLAFHARESAASGRVIRLRYGIGSPFRDLVLPCGGGLDVALVPLPDPAPLRAALAARDARQPVILGLDLDRGTVALDGPGFALRVLPPTRFLTWGAGVEAVTFAALARATGFPVELSTHDDATAAAAQARGVPLRAPGPVSADPWTAITLFYHDHDREPPVLAQALLTPAFYVGAQGSLRSHRARTAALRDMGVPAAAIARLRGPIGLIPSARDPRVLAVSVLAEILAEATA
ncbi:XdhC family protein [uncultured Paracoccus sp.]|uniref:XdhC family protein n=1 Tax=uncultured Paracoccus sp. TaxID=189685 RepID=UPI0026299FD5|nr:XdhC family protein [uncultured Paracoccus sp.]